MAQGQVFRIGTDAGAAERSIWDLHGPAWYHCYGIATTRSRDDNARQRAISQSARQTGGKAGRRKAQWV